MPGLYEAAVADDVLHALEHVTFLSTALLFWGLVVQPHGRRRAGYPIALLSAFTVWMLSGGLGALLTFSSSPLYPVLGHHSAEWGISPLTDQQLAGAVMWVPAGFAYLVAMAVLFVKWMGSLERGAPQPAEVRR
jgi:putative membrane protein